MAESLDGFDSDIPLGKEIVKVRHLFLSALIEEGYSRTTISRHVSAPDIASVPVPDTLAALHVNPETGLTHAEVDTRRKEHGYNEVAEQKGHPFLMFLGKFWARGQKNSSSLNFLGQHRDEEHPVPWKRMLAYITGSVNENLLRRIEYLLEENRVLRNQIQNRVLLTDHERRTLAERAIALGKLMADTVFGEPVMLVVVVRLLPFLPQITANQDTAGQ